MESKVKTAIYAGSFDPITNGHLWMIRHGAYLFDKLIVAVSNNADKKYTFDFQTRLRLVTETLKNDGCLDNVEVVPVENDFIVSLSKQRQADYLLRGIRSNLDYEYEAQISRINSDLAAGRYLKSVFLMPDQEVGHVSSSMVKGLIGFVGWEYAASRYVPGAVYDELVYRFSTTPTYRINVMLRRHDIKIDQNELWDVYEEMEGKAEARSYHNFHHIVECVEQFARVKSRLERPDLVELALYFHDAVYQPGQDDNEILSAKFFLEKANGSLLSNSDKELIAKLIESTNWMENKDSIVNQDLRILHDIDFSIFAASWERFMEYEEGIEKEYSHVPNDVFRRHRRDFLSKLSEIGVFYTQYFDHVAAKNNVDRLLAEKYSG